MTQPPRRRPDGSLDIDLYASRARAERRASRRRAVRGLVTSRAVRGLVTRRAVRGLAARLAGHVPGRPRRRRPPVPAE